MRDYFSRQIRLWGETTQSVLAEKRILIVGSGGLGSSLLLALGASGIAEIDLVDFDRVSLHNIHRQIAFKVSDEGRSKAEAAADLAHARCPYVRVTPYLESFEEFGRQKRAYDLILDATDNLPTRAQIDRYAKEAGIPWIYASVEAFNGQVCFIEESSFEAFAVVEREPAGIAAPMVMQVAAFEANLALRYLAGLPIEKDTLYYFYFDEAGGFMTQKFGMPKA
ncbi:MAG: ThiF family adenylyltransferase [Epsilonproteobacteria bacterium]|nr:ThiF family adenylyltransferase [Campylobacterota bacterium]